jgi:hypothetical protein
LQNSLATRSGRRASQHPDELRSLIQLFKDRGVGSYLEIGARHGDTFHAILNSLPRGSVGVAVDLPGGLWGITSSRDFLDAAISDLRIRGYKVGAVYGDSTDQVVKETVLDTASWYGLHGKFDAILIDGNHRYEGVSADWRIWGEMAPIVAFHDIAGDGVIQPTSGDPVEVPRLWRELKEQHETVEFIAPDSKMGIGVVLR